MCYLSNASIISKINHIFANTRKVSSITGEMGGIGIDIDGVIRRGTSPVIGGREAIQLLKTPLSQINPSKYGHLPKINNLPFMLVSNGGGSLEQHKAEELNKILGLGENDPCKLIASDIILCHTPLRGLAQEYKGKYILVVGMGDMVEVATSYGFDQIISIQEFTALFPNINRLVVMGKDPKSQAILRSEALNRLKLASLPTPPQISAILVMSDPHRWEESLQIISDLLISVDGVVGSIRKENEPQYTKLYFTNPDHIFSDNFHIPRYTQGAFRLCLQELFKAQFEREIEYIQYGKPEENTFQYLKSELMTKFGDRESPISGFYMIGDNPEGDIQGANKMGWTSILTRTGLFTGENDTEYPANYVFDNVLDSVKFILNEEDIIQYYYYK